LRGRPRSRALRLSPRSASHGRAELPRSLKHSGKATIGHPRLRRSAARACSRQARPKSSGATARLRSSTCCPRPLDLPVCPPTSCGETNHGSTFQAAYGCPIPVTESLLRSCWIISTAGSTERWTAAPAPSSSIASRIAGCPGTPRSGLWLWGIRTSIGIPKEQRAGRRPVCRSSPAARRPEPRP
jgi:hypothetical protein